MAAKPDLGFDNKILEILVISSIYIALIYLVILLRTPLTWLAISFFFALAMEPAVRRIQSSSRVKSRGMAAFIIIVIAVTCAGIVAAVLIPPLVSQTGNFFHSAPTYIDKLQHSHNKIINTLNRQGELSQIKIDSRSVLEQIANHKNELLGAASSVASVVTAIVTILVFTFFIILELPQLSSTFWHYQPANKRKHRHELGTQMHKIIIGSVNGNMLTSLIAAIFASLMLAILHIPYAIPLGVLIGLIDLIPLFGASIGAVVVIIITLLYGSLIKSIIIAIYFFIYQRIENNTLQPLVYKQTVHISPLLALFAAMCGAQLAGLVGVLFAIPVAAISQILIKDYLDLHRINEDKSK